MIRIKGQPRFQVSNRLAVLAAILLVASAFSGLNAEAPAGDDGPAAAKQTATEDLEQIEKKRSVNLRLVLFRHG